MERDKESELARRKLANEVEKSKRIVGMASALSSPSVELLGSALAGAPPEVLETALSLLQASSPLIEGISSTGSGASAAAVSTAVAAPSLSSEDRRLWLAAVARLTIRAAAVLEGADDDEGERGGDRDDEQRVAAFERRKPAAAQPLALTLWALLSAFDVRCVF